MENKISSKILPWVMLISLGIVWGTSYILIKRGLKVMTSGELGALRISICFIILLPFYPGQLKKTGRAHWKYLAIVGLIGSAIPAFLFAKAQTGIDSHLAGIINSLTTLFTLVIGILFFTYKTKWFNVLGVILGLIGLIGLLSISGGRSLEFNFSYAVYIIIATILFAFNLNIIKTFLKEVSPVAITILSFGFVGLPVLIYLVFFTSFTSRLAGNEQLWAGIGYIGILAVVGSVLTGIVYNNLIQITGPVFASSVTYIIPMFAILWGYLDGETFEVLDTLWIMMILFGVALVNKNSWKIRWLTRKP